jgi:uracil-DNA glycosylase
MNPLLKEIRDCTHCKQNLPLPPKPILSFEPSARILIAGQAPGRKAHASGIPWNDASGDRLREWLEVEKAVFYDPNIFAIVPAEKSPPHGMALLSTCIGCLGSCVKTKGRCAGGAASRVTQA